MKKISILLSLFSMVFLFSCIEDDPKADFLTPDGAYPYVEDVVNGYYDLGDIANATTGFTVKTSTSGSAVKSITIMKSFNGSEKVAHGTINGAEGTMTISLAEAIVGLGVNEADLVLGDQFTYTFTLNTDDGRALTSPVKVSVPMSCISDIAGTYSVTATYSAHDFLADYLANTMDVEIVQVSPGVYSIADFSGGLYGTGPYVAAYGTTGMPVEFTDVCNNISWDGQSDAWGTLSMVDGGVNSIDPATGVITMTWIADAYGESAVCVYTPL